MPIDRTAYNALVDDDGSNTVGSRWDKAAIKSVLLDPIDASPGLGGAWTNVTFDGANFWPGVAANHVLVNRYTIINKVMVWIVNLSGAPAPAPASPYLYLTVPAGRRITTCFARTAHSYDGAVVEAYVGFGNAQLIAVQKNVGGNWTSGAIYTYFTIVLPLE